MGVDNAKSKPNCNQVLDTTTSYKCCTACKLGMLLESVSKTTCTRMGTSLAEPWRRTFKRCCNNEDNVDEDISSIIPSINRNPCPRGYNFNQGLNLCDDIDECEEESDSCDASQTCINTIGDYMCQSMEEQNCPPGFKFFLLSCLDIDECMENKHSCSKRETCVNLEGSYKCEKEVTLPNKNKCKVGYKYNFMSNQCEDINECQTGHHSCLESQRCDNTMGSFTCIRYTTCGTGYTLNLHTGRCDDNDECAMGMDNCASLGRGYLCRNIQGSFRCEKRRCDIGEILNDEGTCAPIQCQIGFVPGSSGSCVDVDECEMDLCFRGQSCENTMGSFRCTNQCSMGLRLNPLNSQCEDIDECLIGMAACVGIYKSCLNTIGSYKCQCTDGFAIDQGECKDIDECIKPGICGMDSDCQNSPGSFRCVCKAGFKSVGGECIDTNECKEIPGICQQGCTNIWGSYRCHCQAGYKLSSDSRSCIDIDECRDFDNLCLGNCENIPGSYRCSCPDGYLLSSNSRSCQDIDECLERNNVCEKKHQHCSNTRGGFKCTDVSCPNGYTPEEDTTNKRCRRISVKCRSQDYSCLRKPVSISYNFISLISNINIRKNGGINLFEMQSAKHPTLTTKFTLTLKEVRASRESSGKVDRDYFRVKKRPFRAIVTLTKPIIGPQDIVLELMMDMYQHGRYQASAAAKIFLYVSPHEF
ncbi:FBLN1_2 [Lepeophtheirus salmonis]|uniref:FBLN1_2 n=2 Tax=Lepeophtheirus salmonis TaxID=72036 RepID=A0A7R8H8T9_LEPSM|nr:FBLN1_2 [Lepeophtheirus salmonis]CAF2936886.1 FBLN1_2 [Lepeophtheirus salmonis]